MAPEFGSTAAMFYIDEQTIRYLRLTGRTPDTDPQMLVTDTAGPLPIRAVAISPSPNGPLAGASVQQLLRANGYPRVPVLRSGIPFRG